MNKEILTKREKEVFDAIDYFINLNGYSPTVRELAKMTKLKSTASIQNYINKLKNKGYIINEQNTYRSVRLKKEGKIFGLDELEYYKRELIYKEQVIKDLTEENERLNNIIKLIKNNIDITIQIIKEQPTGNDEWILERLNGIREVIKK